MCDLNVALKVKDCAFNIYLEDHTITKDDPTRDEVPFSWGIKRLYMDIAVMFWDIPGISSVLRDDFGCFVGDSLPILDE